jgi:hypothetical protein
MNNINTDISNVKGSVDQALESLTKKMLTAIKNTKKTTNENLNVVELKKTIKDLIENSELNDENN